MPNYFAPYGTFRREAGEPDTPGFRHLSHVGACLIPGRLYQMGAYPALKPGDGAVRGELFELPWLFDFTALDRRRIRLIEPAVVAWVYVYAWPVDRTTLIRSGDWLAAVAAGIRVRRFRDDQLPKSRIRR